MLVTSSQGDAMNRLYFGDNLQVLRAHVADASVDLVYLDPPFNSKRDYNLLFKTPKGQQSDASITAFEDTWHWGQQTEDEFRELMRCGNTDVAELMQALRSFLKENDMMAYLVMMANRLLELHRVLKPSGSLYLHCDPTASHYLKLVLDGVFGKENFRSNITWKRYSAHNDARNGYAAVTDTILFYAASRLSSFNVQFTGYDQTYVDGFFRYYDETGRRYRLNNLASPSPRPNLTYPYKGYPPPPNGWKVNLEKMQELDAKGRLYFPKKVDGRICLKYYLDELSGVPVTNLWDDIPSLSGAHIERLGYPTQKPLALLERIIAASSNEGDVVLDPFCGCGTAVHAAEKLGRQWIGIDITHLAVSLIEKRMQQAFPGIEFSVEGTPRDLDAARDLAERNKHQFELWACTLVGAQPYKGGKKGADGGLDGLLWAETAKGKVDKVIVQVKGGIHVSRANIATLKGDLEREKAAIGLFVTLTPPTREMIKEAVAAGHFETPHLQRKQWPRVQILTIEELLAGKQPEVPDMSYGGHTFKVAKKHDRKSEQTGLF